MPHHAIKVYIETAGLSEEALAATVAEAIGRRKREATQWECHTCWRDRSRHLALKAALADAANESRWQATDGLDALRTVASLNETFSAKQPMFNFVKDMLRLGPSLLTTAFQGKDNRKVVVGLDYMMHRSSPHRLAGASSCVIYGAGINHVPGFELRMADLNLTGTPTPCAVHAFDCSMGRGHGVR